MWREFQEFAIKGNVLDLAVGVIIGGAFGKVVASLVDDIIMPPIGSVIGNIDFSSLFITLNRQSYSSLEAARAAGAPTINVGLFINHCISFFIVGFCVFLLVRQVNRLRTPPAGTAPVVRECPECLSMVPIKARKCLHCTSTLPAMEGN